MGFWNQYKLYAKERNFFAVTLDHFTIVGFITSLFGLVFGLSATADIKIVVCISALALTILCLIWLNIVNSFRSWNVERNLVNAINEIKEITNKRDEAEELIKRANFVNESISAHTHGFAHLLKDTLISFCWDEKGTYHPDHLFKTFLVSGLEHIKRIYDSMTGDKCGVCVKTIDWNNNDFIAETLERDSASNIAREEIDRTLPRYSIKNSAPFTMITSKDYKDRYFACDDLSARGQKYFMPYTNYPEFYNATLVLPIRRNLKDENNKPTLEFDTFGFLCVDNFKGGFENKLAINILSALADMLYCIFYLYKTYPERGKMDETIGIVFSKDHNSEGYPKIKDQQRHKEYLQRVHKLFGQKTEP